MAKLVQRQTIRLPAAAYREPGSNWLVTITAAPHMRPFVDRCFAGAALAMFIDESPPLGIDLRLACLMPDHMHLLTTLVSGDLVRAVGALKSRSTLLSYGFGRHGVLWQRSFDDHGIRTPEALASAVRYVLENPVAAGLASTWEGYDLIDGSWLAGQ